MKKSRTISSIGLGTSIAILIGAACGGSGTNTEVGNLGGSGLGDPVVLDPGPPYVLGDPIRGLSGAETASFTDGKDTFNETENASNGLGPVFNGTSCSECHKQGAIGGAGNDLLLTRVTRIGGVENGVYSDLASVGGPVLQRRSLREFDPTYPYPGEVVPSQAKFVSHRITTPLFGAGLIEAIPTDTILARTKLKLPDGIAGVANRVVNIETGKSEIGRFGWKAQHSSLSVFAGDAYLNEMGVTSVFFPHENLPQGKAIVPGADIVADPEDHTDVAKFASFMRELAPPSPLPLTQIGKRGSDLFASTGCALCHVPSMRTGTSTIGALSQQPVNLYSDLLVHKMGSGLADGIIQGDAKGDMFRTAPLWGLRHRVLFLHDGRANSPEQAILIHGGEASNAVSRYVSLSQTDRRALLEFLSSL